MNVYDFDGTIYKKDSSIELYKFAIEKKPILVFCLPSQIIAILKYKFKMISKERMKEAYFCFLQQIDIDTILDEFVDREMKNINEWYIAQHREDDVVISASPLFLISKFCERLGINYVIATDVDITTGKFYSKNCHGKEKVNRFKHDFNIDEIEKFYSDSKTDLPFSKLAKTSYFVKNNVPIPWESV